MIRCYVDHAQSASLSASSWRMCKLSCMTSELLLTVQVRLDGNVPSAERADVIQRFAAPEVPVMLLSVRAGGVGLNLQVADTVIMYDTGTPCSGPPFSMVSAGCKPLGVAVSHPDLSSAVCRLQQSLSCCVQGLKQILLSIFVTGLDD